MSILPGKRVEPIRAWIMAVIMRSLYNEQMEQQLTENEEKALVGILYNHVTFGTTMQVFGEAGGDNGRINTQRAILEKLLVKYNLIESIAPDVLLLMGITSKVPKEQLEAWAANDKNKHLQLRAQYFLKKIA